MILQIILILFLVHISSKNTINYQLYEVQSDINNKKYFIHKSVDTLNDVKKANKLANLDEKVKKLISSLSDDDERKKLLQAAPLNFQERQDSKDIGYTINKGDKIGLCIGDDDNALFFVTLHELSHIVTKEYGHPKEFWNNFEFLIKKAVEADLYKYKDYNENPINYCNTKISYTPYKK